MTKHDTSLPAREEPPLATWRRPFLAALAISPNIAAAARTAGVSRGHVYLCRDNDPSFAAEWDIALETAIDSLEQECWNRAMGHNIRFLFDKEGSPLLHPHTGQPYYEHVTSDAMASLLLKAHRPEKYKDRSAVDMNTNTVPTPKYDLSKLSLEDKLALREMKRKLTGGEGPSHD